MEDQPKHRFLKFVLLYGATVLLFVCYIFFISNHNIKTHRELNKKIENLERKISHTKNQIGNVYTFDQLYADSALLEKYVREQLNMHKEKEDVFIIVHE